MDCLLKIFVPEKFSVATLCVAIKKTIACRKGAKPKDERAHGCGVDCLPKVLGPRKSLGGDSVRCYKTSIACQKGARPNDERAHGCGMDCLSKILGPLSFSVATLCIAIKNRSLA